MDRYENSIEDFAGLPVSIPSGVVLHLASGDSAAGTDLAVRAMARRGGCLVVVLPDRAPEFEAAMWEVAAAVAVPGSFDLRFVVGPLTAQLVQAVSILLLPVRAALSPRLVAALLAAGRPLVISRFAAIADALDAPGVCVAIGGRYRDDGSFEPDERAIDCALDELARRPEEGVATAIRAREFVTRPRAGLPAVAALGSGSKPVVVLEAPLFGVSSSSVLTIETARALMRRGRVALHLVAREPHDDCGWLESAAPDLVPALAPPPRADLWLSAGWPPRPSRPDTECHAIRFDWEYGALPVELTPLITDEVDRVVVHSRAVERLVAAAGRPTQLTTRIPHGVDAKVFWDGAAPDPEVIRFKGERPAVLFVGGLIWRKGFDLALAAVLRERERGTDPVLVVKELGATTSYAGYHLRELLDKVRSSALAPDVLVIDRELSSSEMAGIYTACDLLLHPYRGEGFGMPVLEARACGLPVVVTRGGSTDDFCTGPGVVTVSAERRPVDIPGAHVAQPWVLEPDATALSDGLHAALSDIRTLRNAACEQARIVRAEHTWASAAAALEQMAFASRSRRTSGHLEVCFGAS